MRRREVSAEELRCKALLATCYGLAEEAISIAKTETDMGMINYGKAKTLISDYRQAFEQGSAFLNRKQRKIHGQEIRELEQLFKIGDS